MFGAITDQWSQLSSYPITLKEQKIHSSFEYLRITSCQTFIFRVHTYILNTYNIHLLNELLWIGILMQVAFWCGGTQFNVLRETNICSCLIQLLGLIIQLCYFPSSCICIMRNTVSIYCLVSQVSYVILPVTTKLPTVSSRSTLRKTSAIYCTAQKNVCIPRQI